MQKARRYARLNLFCCFEVRLRAEQTLLGLCWRSSCKAVDGLKLKLTPVTKTGLHNLDLPMKPNQLNPQMETRGFAMKRATPRTAERVCNTPSTNLPSSNFQREVLNSFAGALCEKIGGLAHLGVPNLQGSWLHPNFGVQQYQIDLTKAGCMSRLCLRLAVNGCSRPK